MITVLPINLLFYVTITVIGVWLTSTPVNTRNLTRSALLHVISMVLFMFQFAWLQNNSILDIHYWYISAYNAPDYTLTTGITSILTPYNFVFWGIALALIGVNFLMIIQGYRSEKQ